LKRATKTAIVALAVLFAVGDLNFGGGSSTPGLMNFISKAEARIGRPRTPRSVAGVARRTTRRVIRRGVFIAAIPRHCAYGTYYGYHLYHCGGVYYQKSGSGYVVVHF
jgi:hypothetical protein